jgi:tRNA modification GTPase
VPAGVPTLRVVNKIDLTGVAAPGRVEAAPPEVWLSARDGVGIELLRAALLEIAGWQGGGEGLYLARERHLAALRTAKENLATAADHANQQAQSLDLFAEELRLAQEALNSITGAFSSDDLLGVIFSRFCIGK